MESEATSTTRHCYCLTRDLHADMILCFNCKKRFHPSCMRSGKPSTLAGDVYFHFICSNCTEGYEFVIRKSLSWKMVIMITLYNLHLTGSDILNYYHMSEIYRFIDNNWVAFFGAVKKTESWKRIVTSTIAKCPNIFLSGKAIFSEKAWWSLIPSRLPSIEEFEFRNFSQINVTHEHPAASNVKAPVIVKVTKTSSPCDLELLKPKEEDNQSNTSSSSYFKGNMRTPDPERNSNLWMDELEIDTDLVGKDNSLLMLELQNLIEGSTILNSLSDAVVPETNYEKVSVNERDENRSTSSKMMEMEKQFYHSYTSQMSLALANDEKNVTEQVNPEQDSNPANLSI